MNNLVSLLIANGGGRLKTSLHFYEFFLVDSKNFEWILCKRFFIIFIRLATNVLKFYHFIPPFMISINNFPLFYYFILVYFFIFFDIFPTYNIAHFVLLDFILSHHDWIENQKI